MEQAMTDDKTLRRNLAAQAKWMGAQANACWTTCWAMDSYMRGHEEQSWVYLFMAEEEEDVAAQAYAEWDAL
jgi:hypothetical protein